MATDLKPVRLSPVRDEPPSSPPWKPGRPAKKSVWRRTWIDVLGVRGLLVVSCLLTVVPLVMFVVAGDDFLHYGGAGFVVVALVWWAAFAYAWAKRRPLA